MPKIDWKRVRPLIGQLLELPEEDHAPFLEGACGEDADLRRTVERLLGEERRDTGFLETPIHGDALGETSDAGLAPGDAVASWRLVRRLAEGGMGDVWLAERPELGQRAALKFVRSGQSTGEILARFDRERRVLASLEHPNIARLVDGGALEGGRPWLAMEYVEGRRLDEACRERRLSVDERVRLFVPILEAVEAAHRRLVVHRDLKPSNVVVQADGTPKLLDFGIAKVLAEDERDDTLTRSGLRPMTPRYASPEQIDGGPVTTASDVYSLGVLLFELLTGRSPYGETTSSVELLNRVCREEARRPSRAALELDRATVATFGAGGHGGDGTRLARKLRGELDWIVLRALEKEPERRYASAERFADDLRRYLAGEPVAAGPDSTRYRLAKLFRRRRVPILFGALAVLALVVATVVSLVSARRANRAAEEEHTALAAAADALAFLGGVVLSPTPDDESHRDVRVLDALMEARHAIDALESPLARWAAHSRIASALAQLGENDAAIEHYRAAIAEADALGEHGVALAEAHLGLAGALERVGRDAEAIPLLERARALLELPDVGRLDSIARPAAKDELRTNVLNSLAMAYEDAGQHERSLALFRAAQETLDARDPLGAMDVVLRFNIAASLLNLGRFDESVHAAEAALHDAARTDDLPLSFRIGLTSGVGHFRWLDGRASEALPLATEAVELAREAFEPDHPLLWDVELGLARTLVDLGKHDEALELLRALRARTGADGVEQELELVHLTSRALARTGQPAEALAEVERVRARTEEALAESAGDLGLARLARAECLMLGGARDAARAAGESALEAFVDFAGPKSPLTERARRLLAELEEGS